MRSGRCAIERFRFLNGCYRRPTALSFRRAGEVIRHRRAEGYRGPVSRHGAMLVAEPAREAAAAMPRRCRRSSAAVSGRRATTSPAFARCASKLQLNDAWLFFEPENSADGVRFPVRLLGLWQYGRSCRRGWSGSDLIAFSSARGRDGGRGSGRHEPERPAGGKQEIWSPPYGPALIGAKGVRRPGDEPRHERRGAPGMEYTRAAARAAHFHDRVAEIITDFFDAPEPTKGYA